ncbi:cell wall binding repeat family protein [Bacillus mycoides]|uniref:N-acetylmuramoyl-L-alanine amidase family protein n=1 Tax=Bacillus mycoides TaxID=1405 RepID=UPI0003DDE637|nr:cell wall-binding protein [Bacillus mycoides]AIW87894.1 cell wall binding repeat family protein [Bacillus mycoides]GAE42739.1 hypothetical protein BW1_072_00460 [Bacillus mycoides NBRC 101238 = DSM 11821]
MKKSLKTTGIGKEVIPVTAALGILFSVAPITENKVSAGVATVLDVGITSLGILKDIYTGLGIEVGDSDLSNYDGPYAENISYRAPNFKSGKFSISVHHTKNDLNFTKQIKVLYPNGKSEIHKLKSGQDLKITEAGTIVDLNPDAASVAESDLLYITQAQLDEGKTGVALNQVKTIYVEKTSGQNDILVKNFYKKKYGQDSLDGFKGLFTDLFAHLTEEQKKIATLTSHPIGREVLSNYVMNNSEALADFNERSINILAHANQILETPLALLDITLNRGNHYQIIPYKKGTNKVVLKTGSKYLSGKEGDPLKYSNTISDDEVFELVLIDQKSPDNKIQFRLNNKNGVSLAGNATTQKFGADKNLKSEIRFLDKSNNEVHNWLRNWYPGKINERQIYDGIRFQSSSKEKDFTSAYDSSGNLIKNSWVKGDEGYSYADSSGVFLKGWQEIEGNTYYFTSWYRTAIVDGNNTEIDGKHYHFDASGALQRLAWKSENGKLYYSDESGVLFVDGLREIDGEIYYLTSFGATTGNKRLEDQQIILQFSDIGVLERATDLNGTELTTPKKVTLDGKQIAFEKNGTLRKPGVTGKRSFPQPDGTERQEIHYYSLKDGANYTGWKTINDKIYYFENGANYIFNGHKEIGGKRYYFNQNGEAKLTGLQNTNGEIYYYNNEGVEQTGWQEVDGKWYYFNSSGEARIGWFYGDFEINHRGYGYFWYYAQEDGSILQNVTTELQDSKGFMKSYTFDSHGHKE